MFLPIDGIIFPVAEIVLHLIGSRKTLALNALIDGLTRLETDDADLATPASNTSFSAETSPRLWSANETITMAKLHDQIASNDGIYVSLLDEIEGLFELLDLKGRPDIMDRRTWLFLNSGIGWSRSNRGGRKAINETRLNYTGWCNNSNIHNCSYRQQNNTKQMVNIGIGTIHR